MSRFNGNECREGNIRDDGLASKRFSLWCIDHPLRPDEQHQFTNRLLNLIWIYLSLNLLKIPESHLVCFRLTCLTPLWDGLEGVATRITAIDHYDLTRNPGLRPCQQPYRICHIFGLSIRFQAV